MDGSSSQGRPDKVKRGYRACLHCRARKAKCDLGDIDAPSSPPCSRCRRESRECVFAPSRRGGNNARRKSKSEPEEPKPNLQYGVPPMHSTNSASFSGVYEEASGSRPYHAPDSSSHGPQLPPHNPSHNSFGNNRHSYGASIHDLIHRSPSSNLYPLNGPPSAGASSEQTPPTSMPTGRTDPHSSTPSPKRRRLHLNPPLHVSDPSSIVVADMQNESDALHILALASDHTADRNGQDKRNQRTEKDRQNDGFGGGGFHDRTRGSTVSAPESSVRLANIEDFALIRLGIINAAQLTVLSDTFFRHNHHFFPMVPPDSIPQDADDLAVFAHEERYLLTAAIIIASKHHSAPGMKEIHDKSWAVMRGWMSDIQCLGAPPTIGLIEALLLLAENLPRDPNKHHPKRHEPDEVRAIGVGEEVHGAENRQAWMLIGMAIRCAYGLGIEKLSLKLMTETDRTPEMDRARLAWTYCYLFDRHISLRLGKAFWSRGPAVCFQGYSSSSQTGPAAAPGNFPSLRSHEGPPEDDYACLAQAYLELTQMMSTAHDTLWPNPSRTKSLMVYGEYFKYLDELARSIDGFRILWAHKKWTTFPLTDCVAAMLHYTTLVVTAFSFQSHLERSAMRAEEENKLQAQKRGDGTFPDTSRGSLSLFPRGAAHSPDARYIFQSCDSARAMLEICVNRLHPGGALPYLPWRFLLWFTYAAVLLLKALYSGAMLRADHAGTLKLIDRLCVCFAEASSDDDHPAVRYGRQLEALRKKLSVMSDTTNASSPTGGHTVPLPPVQQNQHTTAASNGFQNPPIPQWPSGHLNEPTAIPDITAWSLPYPPTGQTPNFSFSYPNTPAAGPAPAVAPPHHQPMSEIHNLQPEDMANTANLGFTTLDDWFGQSGVDNTEGGDMFGGLDLQDFWFQVGPGEAQGGFPFR